MRFPIATIRTLGLLAGIAFAPQPALALKLLTEENPPLNYTEAKKLTGMATEVVQEMLKRAGFYPGEVDGIYDAETEKALEDFQGWENLEMRFRRDGKIDGVVLAYLRQHYGKK